jgi:hypothetical protein
MSFPILWEHDPSRPVGMYSRGTVNFPAPGLHESYLPEGVWELLNAEDRPDASPPGRYVLKAQIRSLAAGPQIVRGQPMYISPGYLSDLLHVYVYGAQHAEGVSDERIARMVEELQAMQAAP